MNLIEVNHSFRATPRRRTSTRRVIVHHSAGGDVSAATIHTWHLARETNGRPWLGIGYHYVIRRNGNIETGRPIDTVGAHAGAKANGDSIGVVLTGNFEQERPTDAQYKALGDLDREVILPRYGKLEYHGHNQYMATTCPGRHFDFRRLEQERSTVTRSPVLRFNGRNSAIPVRIMNGRTEAQLSGHWVQVREFVGMIPGATIAWDEATRTVDVVIR